MIIEQQKYRSRLNSTLIYHQAGKITQSLGLIYEARLPGASVGSICEIYLNGSRSEEVGVEAEVIGFKDSSVILMPYEDVRGINSDSLVVLKSRSSSVKVSSSLLGRVVDGRGCLIDGGILDHEGEERSLYQKPASPLDREIIDQPLDLGIRAINGLLTCGKGQRLGILAASGVGKSVLLGMMARNTQADVNVIALVGERGREVREFIERDLGKEGLRRSVVVVATSDSSPLVRMRAAFLAQTIAEYFQDQGKDVLFLMDSVTRFCMAQREIGLSMGEPPASKGYTPSVFSTLPKLLERAGTCAGKGSITGLYTVLVEGDDLDEPVTDAARSILDGHIVLSRKLAERNHFPAIDILQSTSRVMNQVISEEHEAVSAQLKEWLAIYRQNEDLINLGAYVKGNNIKVDQAIFVNQKIIDLLRQDRKQSGTLGETVAQMTAIVRSGEAYLQSLRKQ